MLVQKRHIFPPKSQILSQKSPVKKKPAGYAHIQGRFDV